jgi:hexosaminidase
VTGLSSVSATTPASLSSRDGSRIWKRGLERKEEDIPFFFFFFGAKKSTHAMIFIFLLSSVASVSVWPQPQRLEFSRTDVVAFPFNVTVTTPCVSSPALTSAIDTTLSFIFSNVGRSKSGDSFHSVVGALKGLSVCVSGSESASFPYFNETYSMEVGAGEEELRVDCVDLVGCLWGLQTLRQLVRPGSGGLVIPAGLTVVDGPRFRYRGLLLDSARHFLPVEAIKLELEAMAAAKLNAFHWHIVDAESFPFGSEALPGLPRAGAFEFPEMAYSLAEIRDVVGYASALGITVVPEFDSPGHAASWGKAYPITASCPEYAHNINNIPLTPASNLTLPVLTELWAEAAGVFLSPATRVAHFGGDEVVFGCWLEDPAVVAWMKRNGVPDGAALQAWFVAQTAKATEGLNLTRIYWEDVFTSGTTVFPEGSIIEVWKDQATLAEVVRAGHLGILAAGNYLNNQVPKPGTVHATWQGTWQDFYANEPAVGLSEAEEALVLGGSGCMWSENIDEGNLHPFVWPRAAAVAERLWSSKNVTDLAQATTRLSAFSCHLKNKVGVPSGPVQPGHC